MIPLNGAKNVWFEFLLIKISVATLFGNLLIWLEFPCGNPKQDLLAYIGNPSSIIRFLVETLEPKTSIDEFYGNPCDMVFFVVETLSKRIQLTWHFYF